MGHTETTAVLHRREQAGVDDREHGAGCPEERPLHGFRVERAEIVRRNGAKADQVAGSQQRVGRRFGVEQGNVSPADEVPTARRRLGVDRRVATRERERPGRDRCTRRGPAWHPT